MSEEKPVRQVRKERSDGQKLPPFAVAVLVLSIIQLLAAVIIHISAYAQPLLLAVLGTATLFLTIAAAMVWNQVKAFRVVLRVIVCMMLAGILALGVISVVYETTVGTAQVSYAVSLYASLVLAYFQMLLVFLLPVSVVAASFGGTLDRWVMRVGCLLNCACVLYFVLYGFASSPLLMAFDLYTDAPLMLYIYAGLTVVATALTFVPALYRQQTDGMLPQSRSR